MTEIDAQGLPVPLSSRKAIWTALTLLQAHHEVTAMRLQTMLSHFETGTNEAYEELWHQQLQLAQGEPEMALQGLLNALERALAEETNLEKHREASRLNRAYALGMPAFCACVREVVRKTPERIQHLKEEPGVGQQDMALLLGGQNPGLNTLLAILEALGFQVDFCLAPGGPDGVGRGQILISASGWDC